MGGVVRAVGGRAEGTVWPRARGRKMLKLLGGGGAPNTLGLGHVSTCVYLEYNEVGSAAGRTYTGHGCCARGGAVGREVAEADPSAQDTEDVLNASPSPETSASAEQKVDNCPWRCPLASSITADMDPS